MSDLSDFTLPVHKSFQQEDLLLGVQKPIFILIFLIGVIIWYLISWLPAVLVTGVIYIPCYFLTKKDPHMLTIALGSLIEPDHLEG